MFLNKLDNEEKDAFLSIAVHAAKVNGIIEKEEYNLLEEYCKEMGVAFFDPQNAKELSITIENLTNSSKEHKKIIMLEILALCKIDGMYDDKERAFMSDLVKGLGLTDDELDAAYDLLVEYLEKVELLYKMVAS